MRQSDSGEPSSEQARKGFQSSPVQMAGSSTSAGHLRYPQRDDGHWDPHSGHETQMKDRSQMPSSALSTPRLPGSFQSAQLHGSLESSARQPLHTQPDLASSQTRSLFSEAVPTPQQFIRGSLPVQHHLRQDSPLSFDGSGDDRLPWGSQVPYGMLGSYSQAGDRHQYSNSSGTNTVTAEHANGGALAGQSLLPGFAPVLSPQIGQNGQSLGSTLAQAFAPATSAGDQLSRSHHHSSSASASAALNNRPRASTLSTATLAGRKALFGQQEQSVPFQRSLSSDGMNTSPLETGRFAATGTEHLPAGPLTASSGSQSNYMSPLLQQHISPYVGVPNQSPPFHHQSSIFSRSSGPSNDSWSQHQDFASSRGHYREDSGGGGFKDHDPSRLSLALAKTQIGGPSARAEPSQLQQGAGQQYGLSSTIIEEEEDYGGAYDLSRRQFPEQAAMQYLAGPRVPKLEVQYQDLGDQSSDSLTAADQSGTFNLQQRTISQSELPQAILQPLTQQYQQQHPFAGAGSVPNSVQRRYRPAVRPSTYQQLNIMDFEDNDEGSLGSLGASGSNTSRSTPDSFIDSAIQHYITTSSRLGLGERTVLIMTSKVAQKSYGAEKRFLCPPPMVLLIGSSWWNVCQDSSTTGMRTHEGLSGPPTVLTPPRVNIAMSGETNNHDGVLEWATSSGRLIDVGNPSSEMAVSGRCIGKQLYITDVDEKRRSCKTLVSVSVPGMSANDARLLGTFASKPIKIISKPSKKRQTNRNAELGIAHGSIVSLFHRLRSQTVSTRYLCVSGAPSWFKGSDGQPFHTLNPQKPPSSAQGDQPSCFVAKMTSWDPFVIYLVDPKKSAVADPNAPAMKPPVMGYPSPPPNALEVPSNGQHPLQVHYNQRIVLQCLNTAAVSPVMVIRKVEKATTVVGGVAASSARPTTDEALGDPVSQLHKIALEVVDESTAPAPVAALNGLGGQSSPPGSSGAFLACLNESVGMRRPVEARKWLWSPNAEGCEGGGVSGASPAMATSSSGEAQSPAAIAAAHAATATRNSIAQGRYTPAAGSGTSTGTRHSFSGGSAASGSPYIVPASQQQQLQQEQQLAEGSSDGGKVKRPRRVSSSQASPLQQPRSGSLSGPSSTAAPATKGRRRGQSLSVLEWQRAQAKQSAAGLDLGLPSSASDTILGDIPSSAAWSAEVADSDIWTIVGTDIARHTFYVPPRVAGGIRPPTKIPDSGIAHLITTPAPSVPITPIPILHSFIPPSKPSSDVSGETSGSGSMTGGGAAPSQDRLVTLLGERLSEDLHVYFGDWRSTLVQVQSAETILCAPPPPASEAFQVPSVRLPILFVRKDGVVFPTESIYSV